MFKIERASKYIKINCFSKYLIVVFFKIEKTQNIYRLVVKNNFTFSPAAVSGAINPKFSHSRLLMLAKKVRSGSFSSGKMHSSALYSAFGNTLYTG